MNGLFYGLKTVIESSFGMLDSLGNVPNVLFILLGFVLVSYWIKQMVAHNKEVQ